MPNVSPMMQHYLQTKGKYSDCIVFYRIGDFYEMFFDDAKTVSRELELTLTGKDCGLEERAPMCGVPFHAASSYIARLIEKGYKVAICEQLTDPALAKGLVERDVIRVITPGTVSDLTQLDEKTSCYVLCVFLAGKSAELAYADVTTGEMSVHHLPRVENTLLDEIIRIAPQEIVTNALSELPKAITQTLSCTELRSSCFQPKEAKQTLQRQFHVTGLTALDLDEHNKCYIAAGALLSYLDETQKVPLEHITRIHTYQDSECMQLDHMTRKNLELTQSLRSGERKGSLLWLLDHTRTAMGARQLKSWVENPLINREMIQQRLDNVECLKNHPVEAEDLSAQLEQVSDMERLLSKISYQSLNARDCLALLRSLRAVNPIRELLLSLEETGVQALSHTLSPLNTLCELLENAINPDAPLQLSDGEVIRQGYNARLDEYRDAANNGKQWILQLEAEEREKTGIKNLRIVQNKIFGYCIEVTKSNYNLVPERYIRRQTLSTCERFATPELQEIDRKIAGAQQQSLSLEAELFSEVRSAIAREIAAIQQNATVLKTVDALLSLARSADEYGYVKPEIREDGILDIVDGRHPIVEQALSGSSFVPNDVHMDTDGNRMLIITGPNMAGKSTYMRQVALITLMAHIGSFVPAASAVISLCDRVFTRIGASDDLAGGQSTFMVEMSETAAILRCATNRSLIVLDEIGRGTSTFDGLAIAWAVVEYLLDKNKIGAKTLFATHYHELSELEGRFEGVKNYCISVAEHGEDIIFLRKIKQGGADKSYGVHVARIAGVPRPVVARAHEIQARLEASQINQESISSHILEKNQKKDTQMDLFHLQQEELINELKELPVLSMTPMQALDKLFLLREKARKL